jgi:hypothetical protein
MSNHFNVGDRVDIDFDPIFNINHPTLQATVVEVRRDSIFVHIDGKSSAMKIDSNNCKFVKWNGVRRLL